MANEKSSHSNDGESGLSLDLSNFEEVELFNEFFDYEASASGGVESAPKEKEPSAQPPTIPPPSNTQATQDLVLQHSSDLSSIPQMSNMWSTSSALIPSYQPPSTLAAPASNPHRVPSAQNSWTQTTSMAGPRTTSSLPIRSYSTFSTFDTPTSNPLMFPNIQNPGTRTDSMSERWKTSSLPFSSHQSPSTFDTSTFDTSTFDTSTFDTSFLDISTSSPQMFPNAQSLWTQAPSMPEPRKTSSLSFSSHQSPSTLDTSTFDTSFLDISTSSPHMFPNAQSLWAQAPSMPEPRKTSYLPFSSHQSLSTLDTSTSNPQMFCNAQSPWAQPPSTYHTFSQPQSQPPPSSFGGSAMPPRLGDSFSYSNTAVPKELPSHLSHSFSYSDVAVPKELPSHLSHNAPPFDMNGLSTSDQFSSVMAAGPYFSRPVDMAAVVVHQGPSKPPATTRQSKVSPPDSPKFSPPVHGFYSNQMKKQKKTAGKATAGKTTGGKTTAGKPTRTQKTASSQETQASPLKRGFEETGRGGGEGEEVSEEDGDGDGTRSLKKQKR